MSGIINALFGGQPENLDYIGYMDCPLCDDDCAEVWRKSSKRKKRGHVKHIWCHVCERVTAHVEVCGLGEE